MLEILKPIVSFYKIMIEAVKLVLNKASAEKRKDLQRRIIEIQLLLEDIIDSAIPLIRELKRCAGKYVLEKDSIDTLAFFFRMQHDRLEFLLHLFYDNTSHELLSLFAPTVRRKVEDIVCFKSAILVVILGEIHYHFFQNEDIIAKLPKYDDSYSLHNWSHERFVTEENYVQELTPHTTELVMTQRIQEQEMVVTELIKCSEEFSCLIREKINLEEAISPKKNRTF